VICYFLMSVAAWSTLRRTTIFSLGPLSGSLISCLSVNPNPRERPVARLWTMLLHVTLSFISNGVQVRLQPHQHVGLLRESSFILILHKVCLSGSRM
jgi:hypothetical protein